MLISYEKLESLQETLDVLAEGETMDEIRDALTDTERYDLDEVRESLRAHDRES